MTEHLRERELGPFVARVYYDPDPMDPREYDHVGIMLCAHRRYDLGDVQGTESDIPQDAVGVMPLYLFDHSGLRITTDAASFARWDSARWDWGQLGVIYSTAERMLQYGVTAEQLEEALVAEVEEYDQYLRGEAYSWAIEREDGEVVRSCGGYSTPEDALECAVEEGEYMDEYRRWELVRSCQLVGIGL